MATALTKRQANVTAVSSAGEAIQAITLKRPDVLVSDIAMPDEDGYGLIEKVRLLENGERKIFPRLRSRRTQKKRIASERCRPGSRSTWRNRLS